MDYGSGKCTINVATLECIGIRKSAPGIVETTIFQSMCPGEVGCNVWIATFVGQ